MFRLVALEASDKKQNENIFNITRQVTSLDKVHGSMLELLESVESLENKVDKSVPDLQREISKMEFNTAQITSTLAVVKEDQVIYSMFKGLFIYLTMIGCIEIFFKRMNV